MLENYRTPKSNLLSLLMRLLILLCFFAIDDFAVSSPPILPIAPIPTPKQVAWQKLGLTAFIHFGMNTFTGQEWGTGTESPSMFNPTAFDANQWVKVLQDAGFKLLILTAKHHDGFCLWPSAFSTHTVANSPWKNGQGDIVKEVAQACHKAGMKFGIYLSPWDRHEATYGKNHGDMNNDYNAFYKNQLIELMSNYGEITEVWWDGAKGDNLPQNYNFSDWAKIVHTIQPAALIFQGDASTAEIRWVGNEAGVAEEPCWSLVNNHLNPSTTGTKWVPAECDVSIRPGWFYHSSEDVYIKTIDTLLSIYESSTGHNAQLLLNVPPDTRGLISDFDKKVLFEFSDSLKRIWGNNIADSAIATASSFRGSGFEPSNVLDTNPNTFWVTPDGIITGSIELNFNQIKTFNMIVLKEPIEFGQRVTLYNIDIWKKSSWVTVASKQVIGNTTIVKFPELSSLKVRLNILKSRASPAISTIKILKRSFGEPNGNLAFYKNAISNEGTSSINGEMNAVDGDTNTSWYIDGSVGSCSLEIDFEKLAVFNKIVIRQDFGKRIKTYKIQYLNKNNNWVDVVDANTPSQIQIDTFKTIVSNKIKLSVSTLNETTGVYIKEFEVYLKELAVPAIRNFPAVPNFPAVRIIYCGKTIKVFNVNNNEKMASLYIVNCQGKTVLSESVPISSGGEIIWNIHKKFEHLSPGIYVINCKGKETSMSIPFAVY